MVHPLAETAAESAPARSYLETLLHLGQLLNSSLEVSQVLHIAIEQVVQFVQAERGFVLLVEEGTSRVWGRATHGIDPAVLEAHLSGRDPGNEPQISRSIVERTLKEGRPLLSLNALDDPRFSDHASVRLAQVRSVLCVPLLSKGRPLGVVYVDNRVKTGVFDERHVEMLTAFANQAAIAIDNARLHENVRRSAEERLRLQQELHAKETQRRALEEANKLKSDFIGFVSHELRNPLTTIRGCVQTMLADPELDPATRAEFHEVIEAEADRMLNLIGDLLDSARLEAGRPLSLNPRELDLRPILEKAARAQKYYKFWTARHRLTTRIAPDLPRIEADAEKLHQILTNLLSNAIKYSPQGGEVRLEAYAKDDGLAIRISDEGVGMNEEQRARLFGRYERLEREDIRRIPGHGLGLFLTRRLVELHGGTVDCLSSPGKGSTFIVTLPARQPAARPHADA